MSFEKINNPTSEIKEKPLSVNSHEGVNPKLSSETTKELAEIQDKLDKLQDKIEQIPEKSFEQKEILISELSSIEDSFNSIKEKIEQENSALSVDSIPELKESSTQLKEIKNSLKTSKLENIENIEKPIFAPVVGHKYDEGFNGKKLLILGDSHYFGKEDMEIYDKDKTDPRIFEVTKNVLEEYKNYINGNGKHYKHMNTYTKGYKVLDNGKMNKNEIKNIIDKTAFYNYVQTPMEKQREAPRGIDYENSEQPFRSVLKELQPDVVIVWGKRCWDTLPEDLKNGKDINFIQITHPSSSFSYQKEYDKIKGVL